MTYAGCGKRTTDYSFSCSAARDLVCVLLCVLSSVHICGWQPGKPATASGPALMEEFASTTHPVLSSMSSARDYISVLNMSYCPARWGAQALPQSHSSSMCVIFGVGMDAVRVPSGRSCRNALPPAGGLLTPKKTRELAPGSCSLPHVSGALLAAGGTDKVSCRPISTEAHGASCRLVRSCQPEA